MPFRTFAHSILFPGRLRISLVCASFIFVILYIYHQASQFDFVNLDDHLLIFQDYSVRHLDWKRAWTSPSAGLYHPLTTLSFLAENKYFGLQASVFHITNIVLHVLNTILVYAFCQKIIPSRKASYWIALVFAVHPMAVESVAWISERKNVLSTFFFLLSCITYADGLKSKKRSLAGLLTGLLMVCALLAKPSAVVLPAIYLLIDFAQRRQYDRRLFTEKIVLGLFSLTVILINWHVQNELRGSHAGPSLIESLLAPLRALTFYISKYFFPLDLSITYPKSAILLAPWQWVTSWIFGTLCLWTAIDARYRRETFLAVSWFIITISPSLKMIPFGDLSPVNDRFLYVPGLGLSYLVCVIHHKIVSFIHQQSLCRFLTAFLSLVTITSWIYLAESRTAIWQSTDSLWRDVLRQDPDHGKAHANLARYYQSIGRFEESLQHFQRALTFNGDQLAPLLADLAYLKMEQNQNEEAKELLAQANAENPFDPRVLNIEGVYLWRRGDLSGAERNLRDALARPLGLAAAEQRGKIMNNLGLVLATKGDFNGALHMYQGVLDLEPRSPTTLYNMGLVYLKTNQVTNAQKMFQLALHLDPFLAEAWTDLGVTAFATGDLSAAASHLQRALTLAPQETRTRRNLSIILAKLGRCYEAQTVLSHASLQDPREETWPPEVRTCGPLKN